LTERDGVLVIADGEGHLLKRVSRGWVGYSSSRRHQELISSDEEHPFSFCRRGERLGMLYWIDLLAFAQEPRAARAPQCLMFHHLMDQEIPPFRPKMRFADAITTPSLRWQRRIGELFGVQATVVPYVLDTNLFSPVGRDEARASMEIPSDSFVLGFSAKASADAFGRKGIDLFAEVVAAAASVWPDITVLLIGTGWDQLASSLRATGTRVVHRSPVRSEDTASLYPAMDVFLCTAREEGGPCTVLEAMSCGVPVVTTDVGHVPELITDGERGFIIEERKAEHFIRAIRHLREDEALRQNVIQAARQFIVIDRDERNAVPRIPFDKIYDEAQRNFARRSRWEVASRYPVQLYLGARYVARRIAGR
jgi:glycosyltransferase involved in cell wall biosynthesis